MARIFKDSSVLNQYGSPSINSNTFANRPAAGQVGRLFVDTTNNIIQRDNGSGWVTISGGGGSIGTLQQVTELGAITSIPTTFGTTNNTLSALTIKGAFNQNIYNGTSDDIGGDTFYQYNNTFNQLVTGSNLANFQFLNEKFVVYNGDLNYENGAYNCINYSILYLSGYGNITNNPEIGNTKLGLHITTTNGGNLSLGNIKNLEILQPYGQNSPNVGDIYGIYIAKQSVANININGTPYAIYQSDIDDINIFKGNTILGEINFSSYKLNIGGTFYLYKSQIFDVEPLELEVEFSYNSCRMKVETNNRNFAGAVYALPNNGDYYTSGLYAINVVDDFIAQFETRINKSNPNLAYYVYTNMPIADNNVDALALGLTVGCIYRTTSGTINIVI